MGPIAVRMIQRFEVLDELGRGGMGAVYRAHDPQLEREVAIKVLAHATRPSSLVTNVTVNLRAAPTAPDDLLAEARLMARLSHPNVLPIYEVGLDGDSVFLVMEYIAGDNLRGWLEHPRTSAQILATLALAARGLAAAHARGIIHRDFKPDNVLIGADGRVCVCDFGIAGLVAPVRPSTQRLGQASGTPRYMAPELFDGAEATISSDVFALCRAIAEAFGAYDDPEELRERELPVELVELVLAGLGRDQRPALAALIVALEHRPKPRRARWPWLAAGAALVAVGAGATASAMRGGDEAACRDDRAVLVGRWDDARRAELRAKLALAPEDTELVNGILATYDRKAALIVAAGGAACEAGRAGELTVAQQAIRASCVERRAIELGAAVHRQLVHPGHDLAFRARIAMVPTEPTGCTEIQAPPLPADRTAVIQLYDRYALADELTADEELRADVELERDATQLGEVELAARAALSLGIMQGQQEHPAESDASLERAYRGALAIKSSNLQALALLERGNAASVRGDTIGAESYDKLALVFIDDPHVTPRTRVRILYALGHAEKIRSEIGAALGHLDRALGLIASEHLSAPDLEIELRDDKIDALLAAEGKRREAVALARDTVKRARELLGEHHVEYGNAAHFLAYALEIGDDYEGALGYRRQALDVWAANFPPEHNAVVLERDGIASDLVALGQLEPAAHELEALLALIDRTPVLHELRVSVAGDLGAAWFAQGRHAEAVQLFTEALDESTAQYGKDQLETIGARETLATALLELGHHDEVARHLAEVERAYRAHAEPMARRLAILHGQLAADLATSLGHAHEGEALAREALATLAELGADDAERWWVLYQLGRSRIAQQRYDDARAPLDESRAIATKLHLRPDYGAAIDVQRAHVALGTGHRAEGLALARDAVRVLADLRGQPRARAEGEALLRR